LASPSGGLKFRAEMAAAGFAPVSASRHQQFGEFQEIGHAPGVFEVLVQLLVLPGTLTFFQNSSRKAGIFAAASFNPFSLRAMPHFSHIRACPVPCGTN
jgi:hypothetical protein